MKHEGKVSPNGGISEEERKNEYENLIGEFKASHVLKANAKLKLQQTLNADPKKSSQEQGPPD